MLSPSVPLGFLCLNDDASHLAVGAGPRRRSRAGPKAETTAGRVEARYPG